MSEVEEALKKCGFGLFHVRLLITTFVGVMSMVLVNNTTSFLLPIAECDLKMNLAQKGLLTAIPFVGMFLTSIFTAFLADAFGRKQSLLIGLGGLFIFTIISASSQAYEVLVASKFFEGVLYSTLLCSLLTMIAELCHKGIRDRMLVVSSLHHSLSIVLVSAISWGILINDWKYTFFGGRFVLNTWNIYLYAMSLWPLTGFIMYSFLPESPHFLISQGRYAEARDVLTKIYRENFRNCEDKFPFKDLWKENEAEQEIKRNIKVTKTFLNNIVVSLHNTKPIFRKPMVNYLLLMGMISSILTIIHDVLRLWFPQIWAIVEHSSFETSKGKQDICQLLDSYTANLTRTDTSNTSIECIPIKSGDETYIFSIILNSVSCIPTIFSGILVDKMGKKKLISFGSLLAFGAILAMRWANSKMVVVTLFAIGISVSRLLGSLNRMMVMEYFPASVRTLTIAVTLLFGQMGTLAGNIVFPILLNINSSLPFYILDVITYVFLPIKRKKIVLFPSHILNLSTITIDFKKY
ncbi:hypothetical protein ABMA28_006089 [Loxostege sticticalis]|uniref:Major facilitator superfamily (MFS) profile domain-containing protein n=1 Tax=Loxostege sticticalis TaxID=481309 RepID=A0ABD0SJY5_LOXSC